MYYLLMQSGPAKGRTWLIQKTPLLVGRETACHVQIPDPLVSRKHCELFLSGDHILLRDLGSRNKVAINGEPVLTSCPVSMGDEIRIGQTIFAIVKNEEMDDPAALAVHDRSTLTMTEEESCILFNRVQETSMLPSPRINQDLRMLFDLSVALGSATSLDELTRLLGNLLAPRFKAQTGWLLFLEAKKEDFYMLYPEDFLTGAAPPRDEMLVVLQGGRGAVFQKTGENEAGSWVVAAPIRLGSQVLGALGLERTGDKAFERADLDFLLAVAHIAAPFFKVIEQLEQLRMENLHLRAMEKKSSGMLGTSSSLQRVKRLIQMVATSAHTILVTGETGTGKELAARLIHDLSPRANGPLIIVNCAAIPKELFESEIFGYEKGAFTGATARRIGLMEQSRNGTLFLDEIGDLSLENQAKILRAVEARNFRRIGSNDEIHVDFRLIAATNKDLAEEIERGTFRSDLYHRLRGIQIQLPRLRERREDIPELARHFLANSPQTAAKTISPKAMEFLINYKWPGNIRELKAVIEAAATIAQSNTVEEEDIKAVVGADHELMPFYTMAEVEKIHIERVLQFCRGNVVEAAKRLGVSKSTLYNRLTEYGLAK